VLRRAFCAQDVGLDGTLFVVVDRRGSVVKVSDSVRQWRDRSVGRFVHGSLSSRMGRHERRSRWT
jgi:hypothetical protein